MLNNIKIAAFLALATTTLTLSAGECKEAKTKHSNKVIEKAETKAKSYLSSKKHKKLIGKMKANLNEKKEELLIQISDSRLSDSQKVGLVEALETTQAELN
ncbi:MAG TPA: hypothetical protein VGP47_00570 [Parachlamydiaceae bacterium]|nr:hypothetical protein [Parachlamydiaceae bacterium]